jgi:hypothetical protein
MVFLVQGWTPDIEKGSKAVRKSAAGRNEKSRCWTPRAAVDTAVYGS